MSRRTTDATQRAAEAAAKARVQAAARARAEAARTAAATKAPPKRGLPKDELSTGRGTALRRRGLDATGGALKVEQVAAAGPRLSVAQLLAAQKGNAPLVAKAQQPIGATVGVVKPPPTRTAAMRAPGGGPAAVASQTGSTARASEDAARVQRAWAAAKAAGKSDAQAAKAAAAELERLSRAHPGDAAYVNTLIREAGPTLERVASTLGANTEGTFKSGADARAIKDTVHSLAVVAEQGGAVTAGTLAAQLAEHVDDDSELYQFDDGFYAHKDGGGTNLLLDATVAAMRQMGHDAAAGELAERGGDGGAVDAGKDGVGTVVGSIADGFGAVAGFAKDLGQGVLHVVSEAGEFAVDVAKGTLDAIDDPLEWGADKLGDAVAYAASQGLKLTGRLMEAVQAKARDAIDGGLGITKNVSALGPGDSLSLGGSVRAQLGVSVEASAEIEVRREQGPDGKPVYTVSGEVDASVGIGVGGSGSAGLGGEMSFSFDNPEDAARAANILAAGAAGVAALTGGATAVLAPALLPTPDDLSFLQQHLSSVEVSASVGAHFDSAAGLAEADVGGEVGYRLNFENGKPVSVTRTTELSAEGSVGGPLELVKDSLGNALKVPGDAKAEGSVTVETTIPIDGSGVTDLVGFLANPAAAAVTGEATTSITIEGTFTVGGSAGSTGSITVDGIEAREVRSIVGKLLGGDARRAFEGVDVQVSGSVSVFTDRGFDVEFDGTVAGQGLEVSAQNDVRDELLHREFELVLGQKAPPPPARRARPPARVS
jgi:hypothetical protein